MMQFANTWTVSPGRIIAFRKVRNIKYLLTDSRKAWADEEVLFFAIRGERHDGHQFLGELYEKGVRQFVVERDINAKQFPEANIVQVPSTVAALQQLAALHRKDFSLPVIGITGSNGKTIVKEWLNQLLSPEYSIVKNPGSFNSQIGVPLSIWPIEPYHTLGIFEAGISRTDEMERLEKVIKPTIGIFTNLGTSHDSGFPSQHEKAKEKARLFAGCDVVIFCKDHPLVYSALAARRTLSWSLKGEADIKIRLKESLTFEFQARNQTFEIQLPLGDAASVENAFHCIAVMIYLNYNVELIKSRITQTKPVAMRLELKEGINRCKIVDDSYNNDLAGLKNSLDFLDGLNMSLKTVILSDLLQTGSKDSEWIQQVTELLKQHNIKRFIGIGPVLSHHRHMIPINSEFYKSTDELIKELIPGSFQETAILIKGARTFSFEKIVSHLQRKIHGTVMEIDLGAIVDNFRVFRSRLHPSTKIMAMVKAFGYGSGGSEVAGLLQFHKIDYLGVAYADEGVDLRKNNNQLPIMVMNPTEKGLTLMMEYQLEPEIYSLELLRLFGVATRSLPEAKIHVKIDTGMHRLGLEDDEVVELLHILREFPQLKVASLFSHLAASDEPEHDDFTKLQAQEFTALADGIERELSYRPMRHLLNSAGILRFPEFQFDMVRVGIGLYGIDPSGNNSGLLTSAVTLKTVISQIRKVKAGDSVGYGRMGKAFSEMKVATLAIGYADGFSRANGNGRGVVLINGKRAPVVGNVCMDMTMVDVTGLEAVAGDEAVIFGKELPLKEVAGRAGTIPYEVLTKTSERVKRVFFAESL